MTKGISSIDVSWTRRGVLGAGLAVLTRTPPAAAADRSPTGFIDAHVHVWSHDTTKWLLAAGHTPERMAVASFTPEEFLAHSGPCGVERAVLIQMSYYGSDNSYMLDVMRRFPGRFAGVARVDGEAHPVDAMRRLAAAGVRGFRIVGGRAEPGLWLDGAPMAGMWRCAADANLALCPLIDPQHLPALDAMCARHPGTPVVIDHLARIGADGTVRDADVDALCRMARHPAVRVKLSAFYALGEKRAPHLDLAPMIRRVLGAFGPERLMWASDSPFQVLRGHRYRDSIELIRSRLDFLTAADRTWILARTAESTFFCPAGAG